MIGLLLTGLASLLEAVVFQLVICRYGTTTIE